MIYTGVGSRQTPKNVQRKFYIIGRVLGKKGIVLRSGHAPAADMAFENGCDDVKGPKEIYLPWRGFNESNSNLYRITQEGIDLATKYCPYLPYVKIGTKKLLTRDVYQVLGYSLKEKSDFLICWTENGEKIGGTAMAIKIAEDFNIPIFNFGSINGEEEFYKFMLENYNIKF